MPTALLALALGMAGLYWGAEWFVRGASSLARGLRISAAIVGLTVVSLASSSPELITSLAAAFAGSADLVLGNIVGSNVANIGLVLGLSALLRPMAVSRGTLRSGLPFAVGAAGAVWFLSRDGALGRADGCLLLGAFAVFMVLQVRAARAHQRRERADAPPPLQPVRDGGLIAAGLLGMVVGAKLLVSGATTIAQAAGLSQAFIGISIVAVGTSLPELATSTMAAWKGESDIAIGNVLGSNVLNVLFVLALVILVKPLTVSPVLLRVHYPALAVFSVGLIPLLLIGARIGRPRAGILSLLYVLYIGAAYATGVVPG